MIIMFCKILVSSYHIKNSTLRAVLEFLAEARTKSPRPPSLRKAALLLSAGGANTLIKCFFLIFSFRIGDATRVNAAAAAGAASPRAFRLLLVAAGSGPDHIGGEAKRLASRPPRSSRLPRCAPNPTPPRPAPLRRPITSSNDLAIVFALAVRRCANAESISFPPLAGGFPRPPPYSPAGRRALFNPLL